MRILKTLTENLKQKVLCSAFFFLNFSLKLHTALMLFAMSIGNGSIG